MMRPNVRVGVSGWRYPEWRGDFYPEGLVHRRELEYVAARMRTVEINGSFYSLQRPSSYKKWAFDTPADFVFAVKGGRFMTHTKRLRDCETPLANFFASGVLALEQKLGPILWQLPPQLSFVPKQLEDFLALLPRTTKQAARLATRHDHRLKYEPHIEIWRDVPLRYAIEVRHPSFDTEDFFKLLRKHHIALCIADTAGKFPFFDEITADFVYVRLHGDTELYASSYMPAALDRWAKRIAAWTKGGRDAYVYFDNDAKGHAPYDALNLGARFGYGASADEERPVRSRLAHAVRGSIRKAPHPMRARSPKLSV